MYNNKEIDVLAIISVILGIMNVQENRQQSAHNDVEAANNRQAEFLLGEIYRLFEEQNRTLDKICRALEKIEEMEKEEKNGRMD